MSDDLGAVGELAALARILPRLGGAAALLGPGDDAALLAAPDGRVLLSTDVMVEGPDFRRAWSTPEDLGRKAVATNLADVAAMGGAPTGLLVALTAPADTPVTLLEGIADGMAAACSVLAPGIGVVGGDLTRSPVLTIAVTVAGDLQGRAPVTRAGARPGDVLGYAGDLGLAGAALRLLFAAGEQDPAAVAALRRDRPGLLAAQLAPTPPIAAGPAAALAGATAMLDVSDGLLRDGARIARASGVDLDLDASAVEREADVVAAAAGCSAEEALAAVLGGGEDHGLLATFSGALPTGFRRLGRVLEGTGEVRLGGAVASDAGWDSFAG
ncbi:thiamine-phosphate kinase [Amnibacterium endophyticum]|uniref:Thiamine-monophosphate kinase n=1 Tax=Amnibacterium endophyticum TaxID=2109337 RepID=A0ABW4LIX0_9MICO